MTRKEWHSFVTLTVCLMVVIVALMSACRPVEPLVTRPPGWSVCETPGAVTDRGECQ